MADNLSDLKPLDEDSDMDTGDLELMNETYATDSGYTTITLKEQPPISVFRSFFTEDILNLITDQTNIYGRGRKSSNNRRKSRN